MVTYLKIFYLNFCFSNENSDLSRMQKLRKLDKSRRLLRHFVTKEWVTASIDAASQLNERNYEPLMPQDNSGDSGS